MALFEITGTNGLTPYRSLAGQDLYEREIEDLFWENPESFLGEPVFKLRRQAALRTGGIADCVLIDRSGRVIVVEIKRDIDTTQLAQCLEYAGWARRTNLDELAALYPNGIDAFFGDWLEFTDSTTPMLISGAPRLALIARGFAGRTEGALDFLIESGVPVVWVPVTVYEDESGRRIIDIESGVEPDMRVDVVAPQNVRRENVLVAGRRVTVSDLVEADLISAGTILYWDRPRVGQQLRATVEPNGAMLLPNGGSYASPSTAATEAAGGGSFDGWEAWRVGSPTGPLLVEVRQEYVRRSLAE